MRKSLQNLAVAVGAALGTWATISVYQVDKALTEKPARVATKPEVLELSSEIFVPVRLDNSVLSELAEKLIPRSFDISERVVFQDGAWTKVFGKKIWLWRITIKGRGHVQRTSPIRITADQDGLVVSTTVRASFTAFRGSLRETAHADAQVSARVVVDVDENWQPVVRVTPSYSWINRPVARLFNLFDLSLGTVAGEALNKQIAKLQTELPTLVRKSLPLREIMA